MVDSWPSTLPQQLQMAGASKGLGDALVELQPDTGPSFLRRRTTTGMRPLAGAVICSAAQIAIFEDFFYNTILSGSLPFIFPDPITSSDLLVRFTKQTPPSYAPLGGDSFQLSLTLNVLP